MCSPSQVAVETQTVTVSATATSSAGRALRYQWSVESAPPGTIDPTMAITSPATASTPLQLLTAGTWRLRLTATDAAGLTASCVTVVEARPAIELVCPPDLSRYQSDTAELVARATSNLGRALDYAWSYVRRPTTSAAPLTPATGSLTSRFVCDALGDYVVRLTVRDAAGLTRSCTSNVHVDPDVLATCPPDVTSVPFTSVRLEGNGLSRRGLPLTYHWSIVARPTTSTASLTTPEMRVAGFMFDVAGDWVWRLTVSNTAGNSASCTTRAFARSEEAVRVELVWNVDRSCRSCNAEGGGIDVDLHLTDLSRSMDRWASNAPDSSDCYYANCRCDRSVGMLCPDGVLAWPPEGAINNPQLDVDHIGDLPGPENINVVRAAPGARFAVGVHYFNGSEPTPAVVRVYCGGVLVFESERVVLTDVGGPSANPLWRVGVVQVGGDGRACTFARCGSPGALGPCIRPHDMW